MYLPNQEVNERKYETMRESEYLALKGDYSTQRAYIAGKYDAATIVKARIEKGKLIVNLSSAFGESL